MAAFPAEYRAEPAIAHAGGGDGMDLVRRIIESAGRISRPTARSSSRSAPAARFSSAISRAFPFSGSRPRRARARSSRSRRRP